jgi:arylsulfatase A-like enzyme
MGLFTAFIDLVPTLIAAASVASVVEIDGREDFNIFCTAAAPDSTGIV